MFELYYISQEDLSLLYQDAQSTKTHRHSGRPSVAYAFQKID